MDIKNWLNRGNKIDERIQSKRAQIKQWRDLACSITTSYSLGSKVNFVNKREQYIDKCTDKEAEITADMINLIDIKCEITQMLRKIADERYQLLLELRYLLGNSVTQIAETMNYTIRQVARLHDKALIIAAEIINMS